MEATFLDRLYEALPKSLVGAVIPAAQFAWKLVQDRKEVRRKATLRSRIAELSGQRDAFARLDSNPERALLIADLDAELKKTIDELLAMRPDNEPRPEPPPTPKVRRALLLFVPSGVVGWVLHVFFFVYLFGLISAVVSSLSEPFDDLVLNLAVIYLFYFPAELLRRLALRNDRQRRIGADEQIRRHRMRWIPTVLFWTSMMFIPLGFLTPFMDEPGGFTLENMENLFPYWTVFGGYFVLLAVCARGWISAFATKRSGETRNMGRLRSAFLLYRPNQPRGWLATLGFFASLGYLAMYLGFLVYTRKVTHIGDLGAIAIILLLCSLLIVAAKGWASQYRPSYSSNTVAESAPISSPGSGLSSAS